MATLSAAVAASPRHRSSARTSQGAVAHLAGARQPGTHRSQAYTLVGPEALNSCEVASLLSASLGRAINYEPIGLWRYRRELQAQHLPKALVNVQLLINVVARLGLAARKDDTLPRLLERAPTRLGTYIQNNSDLWQRPNGTSPTIGTGDLIAPPVRAA